MRIWITFFVVLGLSACTKAPLPAGEAKLINTSLETSNLPDGVLEYAVWEPPGYVQEQPVPLIINLHGGGGARTS